MSEVVVGVVGPGDAAAAAVRAAGAVARAGPAGEVVPGSDYVVAVGEAALLSVARATPAVPVLPVAAGRGVRSVPESAVEPAIEALLSGEFERDSHPLFEVAVDGGTATRVLQDVMLVSAEPAHISEYTVRAGGERVARVRADGVVVAAPAGSSGYANAAGGPVVPPGTDAVVAVAVAPFSTDVDHWVLPPTDLRLSVERDVTEVHLVADDRVVDSVGPGSPVRVTPAETVAVAVVADSRSCFRAGR